MGNYPAIMRSKWFLPLFSLGLGVVVLAASRAGGSLGSGLVSLAVMAGFGLFILLAGRSETIRGLRGDGRDERFAPDRPAGDSGGRPGADRHPDRGLAHRDRPGSQRKPVHLAVRHRRPQLRARGRILPLARLTAQGDY
jgi:hypothetical protein